jgi:hypothetical protein
MRKILLALFFVLTLSPLTLAQKKVITNFDLEKYKQQRLQSEAEYDREAARRGLPSREELAERERQRQEFLSEFSQQYQAQQAESANFWEAQAFALRTEIAAVEAEINYVRNRVGEIPVRQTYYSVGYLPYSYGGKFGVVNNGVQAGINTNTGTFGGRGLIGANGRGLIGSNIGNQTSVAVAGSYKTKKVGVTGGYYSTRGTNYKFGGYPYQTGIIAVPLTFATAENLTREELIVRLTELEQSRAGLYARFSVLQDEARRNGVKID